MVPRAGARDQNGNRRPSTDSLGHAAENSADDPAPAVCADDDQICMRFASGIENRAHAIALDRLARASTLAQ